MAEIHKETGVLHSKSPLQSFKNGTFHVQRFILETKSAKGEMTYTETPEFTLLGDAALTLEHILEGSEMEVSFVLTGKTIPGKDGKSDWHKTELKAIFVKVLGVPDVQANADMNPFLDGKDDGGDTDFPF